MFQQDLVVRAIEQLGDAVARLVGLLRDAPPAEVLEAIEDAKGALPLVPGMVDHVDAATLFKMLGQQQTVFLAKILGIEAEAFDQLGRQPMPTSGASA